MNSFYKHPLYVLHLYKPWVLLKVIAIYSSSNKMNMWEEAKIGYRRDKMTKDGRISVSHHYGHCWILWLDWTGILVSPEASDSQPRYWKQEVSDVIRLLVRFYASPIIESFTWSHLRQDLRWYTLWYLLEVFSVKIRPTSIRYHLSPDI